MIIEVANVHVDRKVMTSKFACDLSACRGACCTMPGGRGAPLEEGEIKPLLDSVKAASRYLSEGKRKVLDRDGAIEGRSGDYATRCIEDQDCVFVYYHEGVAKCAVERAWIEGESKFRKPLSCHLFPIRVDELFTGNRLRYEEISECDAGVERGEKEEISLIVFLEEPLVRAYGREFYQELLQKAELL